MDPFPSQPFHLHPSQSHFIPFASQSRDYHIAILWLKVCFFDENRDKPLQQQGSSVASKSDSGELGEATAIGKDLGVLCVSRRRP
mmetsp:Transcript_14265/g.29365  ORF Transcript_14265/g.29365 Transcript_14265/m.29365 type:complete len:85 (+) Transcript_14265:208-462(+)